MRPKSCWKMPGIYVKQSKEQSMSDETCTIDGCESTHRIRRGWCNAHYLRWLRHGDPLGGNLSPNPERGCSVKGCEIPHFSKGMCQVHAARVCKTGTPFLSGLNALDEGTTTLEERFWNRAIKRDGCWQWDGSIDVKGYGRITFQGRNRLAHRISFELHRGEIPDGADIDHKCRNRACVNPDHLHAVTHWENTQNLASRGTRSASGYRGVSLHRKSGKWKAEVRSRGKLHYLGLYETPELADEAARVKRNELFTNNQEDRNAHVHR